MAGRSAEVSSERAHVVGLGIEEDGDRFVLADDERILEIKLHGREREREPHCFNFH